tara:strand:+ start:341 stop:823 length:483 start_codon:yes stop_codon:yes gene_type:complete
MGITDEGRYKKRKDYKQTPTRRIMDRLTRQRLYARAMRNPNSNVTWMDAKPMIDLTTSDRINNHVHAHPRGIQTIGDFDNGRIRAVLLDRDMNPVGLRIMRDLRAGTDASTIETFIDTARGRVDGKRRFTGQLLRFWGEVNISGEIETLPLVGIFSESDL